MRGLPTIALALALALALGAGCYAPDIAAGGACMTACPGDLLCVEGTCVAEPPDPSLIAHWRFDDPPEDGALDSSGRGHHATCSACPTLVEGKHGGGYRFDAAIRQLLVVPDHPDFRGQYTIVAWIYSAATPSQIALMSKPFGDGSGNSWQLEVLTDDRVSLSGGSPHMLASPDPITAGAWHHVAGSWDGKEKELFIDGEKVIEVAAGVEYDGHAIYLGGDQNGGEEVLFWDGIIDDVRVYNRELPNADIADLAR